MGAVSRSASVSMSHASSMYVAGVAIIVMRVVPPGIVAACRSISLWAVVVTDSVWSASGPRRAAISARRGERARWGNPCAARAIGWKPLGCLNPPWRFPEPGVAGSIQAEGARPYGLTSSAAQAGSTRTGVGSALDNLRRSSGSEVRPPTRYVNP